MEFIDSLELVCRAADLCLADQEIPLTEKINRLLDEWFRLIGEQRREPVLYEDSDMSD
jgi:hypothetical protein